MNKFNLNIGTVVTHSCNVCERKALLFTIMHPNEVDVRAEQLDMYDHLGYSIHTTDTGYHLPHATICVMCDEDMNDMSI